MHKGDVKDFFMSGRHEKLAASLRDTGPVGGKQSFVDLAEHIIKSQFVRNPEIGLTAKVTSGSISMRELKQISFLILRFELSLALCSTVVSRMTC